MEKKKNTPPAGECRGCAALRHGDCAPAGAHGDAPPHFLFETSKRKCAVHGGKEKMFGRINLTPLCQVDRKGESCRGRCLRKLAVSYRMRPTRAEPGAPAAASGEFRLAFGVDDERPVLLAPRVPLRYALPRHTSQRQRKETQAKSV